MPTTEFKRSGIGGLFLDDFGIGSMTVQAAQSAYAAALQDTRRNLGNWSQQLNTDGALV